MCQPESFSFNARLHKRFPLYGCLLKSFLLPGGCPCPPSQGQSGRSWAPHADLWQLLLAADDPLEKAAAGADGVDAAADGSDLLLRSLVAVADDGRGRTGAPLLRLLLLLILLLIMIWLILMMLRIRLILMMLRSLDVLGGGICNQPESSSPYIQRRSELFVC